MSRLLARLRSERGFTIIELMVAAAVGSVVMLAIFMLLDTSVKQSGKVTARVDSTQRGRTAMERITRDLRSQVCFTAPGASASASITAAGPYSITFHSFNGGSTGSTGVLRPERHTIAWNTNTSAIEQTVQRPSPATGPVTGWQAAQVRRIVTNAKPPAATPPATGSGPVFEYRTTGGTLLSGNPLSAGDVARIAQIKIRFETVPTTKASTEPSTSFESQVFVRTADPNGLVGGVTDPTCS